MGDTKEVDCSSSNPDESFPSLLVFISTCRANVGRRKAIRRSWMQYLGAENATLSESAKRSARVLFVASCHDCDEDMKQEQDLVLVDAPEGYENLWRKALVFLSSLTAGCSASESTDAGSPSVSAVRIASKATPEYRQRYDYVMHADDDSFLRLDSLIPFLIDCPRSRFYWGYIWDGTGNRVTAPIRNPLNKSHMPESQYPLDFYPPFASGCGFILSWDLVLELTKQPLPDYRLLDPPFGIHLCGEGDWCVVSPQAGGRITPVHDERVRPYRPIPIFRNDTFVQHYLRPEEMQPYYIRALQESKSEGTVSPTADAVSAPQEVYDTLVNLGLLRR